MQTNGNSLINRDKWTEKRFPYNIAPRLLRFYNKSNNLNEEILGTWPNVGFEEDRREKKLKPMGCQNMDMDGQGQTLNVVKKSSRMKVWRLDSCRVVWNKAAGMKFDLRMETIRRILTRMINLDVRKLAANNYQWGQTTSNISMSKLDRIQFISSPYVNWKENNVTVIWKK